MIATSTRPSQAPTNLVRPAVWTVAAMNAKRLSDLHTLVAEAQARSVALTAAIMAQIAADPSVGPSVHERQLWNTLDVLERLRIEQWVLSQAAPT